MYGQFANTLFSPNQGFGGVQTSSVAEIMSLQKALRENTEAVMKSTVGYPQQGVNFTGSLSPLVPQSIQGTLDSATLTMEDVVLWQMLRKVPALSTLHETTRINEHGNGYLDPFIAEGGIGPINETEYERLTIQIKYLAEHIELSDVSLLVGILGQKGMGMLGERTQRGTLSLLDKVERSLVHSDSSLTPLAYDGIIKQVTDGAPDNVTDMAGAVVTPQDLIAEVAKVRNEPNFGKTSVILCDHRSHSALSSIATAHGRHDQFKVSPQNTIQWGSKKMTIVTSAGEVPIVSMPLINQRETANTIALGGSPPPALSGLTPTITNLGATAGSLFLGTDAGAYRYQVVGVGDGGVTAPISLGPVTVAAGEAVRIKISDTLATGSSAFRYYRVYRSPIAGAAGTETYMGSYAVNNLGAPDSWLVDLNANRPSTSPMLLLDLTEIQWVKLLDFLRRPLAQTVTAVPFLLMLFGALHLPTPKKHAVLTNCGRRL
jgi:hypothetical protein